MKILVSNDDGYRAPGIVCLAEMLAAMPEVAGVTVVAPDRNRSGASNSLTLDAPIRASHHADNGFISVNGTPTDCVHLAVTGLLEETPDMVVSGINEGANLGDDVLYSGTVAAAMEGRFLGRPALALSLVLRHGQGEVAHYPTAGRVAQEMVRLLREHPLPDNTILNVNVPNLPWDNLAGIRPTRLGHRHKSEPIIKSQDPRGQPIYWIGPPGGAKDEGDDTDFYAVKHGYVSVTPLHIDLTRHATLASMASWLRL
jgi:5'-nucleotidase